MLAAFVGVFVSGVVGCNVVGCNVVGCNVVGDAVRVVGDEVGLDVIVW